MDIRIFDNFEDDGQLTLFGLEDYEDLRASGEEAAAKRVEASAKRAAGKQEVKAEPGKTESERTAGGPAEREQMREETAADAVRIRSCSSCGKLLFVREEDGGYVSACSACGIQYIQR